MILLCVLVCSVVFWLCFSCFRPKNYPPGPGFLPIVGNLMFYKNQHKKLGFHHLVWMNLAEKFGPIVGLKLGRSLVVTVSGPAAIKEVLTRAEFDGRPDGFFFRLRTFGKRLGIVFSDGPLWKTQRRFSLHHLRNFGFGRKQMEEKIQDECKSFVEKLNEKCNLPVFMHNAFDISVLNALWAMLAGKRFDVDDERLTTLLQIIHECFRIVDMSGGLINQMPFIRYLAPSACGYNQILDVLNRMWTFLQETVDGHKRTILSQPRDLIDAFLHSMTIKVDVSFTDDQLIALCLDLFMAGAETTSSSLGFAAMYMVLNPDVQKKVQAELDEVVGRGKWPTLKDKGNLKYTQAVLLELQRISNLAPMGIAHRAVKTTKLMGYDIAENTIILTNLYSLHMDPKIWENPKKFQPERFLDRNKLNAHEDYYIPFGLGPPWRPFIGNGPELRRLAKEYGGQHLAITELARRYDTEVVGLKLGKERVICVCSYATVRQVLTSDDYQGRPDNFFMKLRTMGTRKGITVADGDLWKEQRAFLVSHLRALGFGTTLMEQMIKEEIKQTITLIEKNVEMVDLSATLAPSILNILWTLTSGKNVKGNNRVEKLLQLLRQRTRAFDMSGGTLNNYPWLRFVAPEKSGYNLMKTINIEVRNLIMETINDHKKSWKDERCDDFIYSFLTEMKKREGKRSYFSEEQLVMVCLDIFIAGSATTSNTIDTALLAMILYPEVQDKVHQSLDSAFKKNADVSYCDKERVPYVNAVLLECQRYFPVVPVIGPRRVLKTTHLDEYLIPKETTVLLNLHSVHHDQNYWKDPAVFRPERFLDENSNLICQDRVLTFGLGKRRCLGEALARACLFLFFVEILRKYKIEYTGSTKPTGKQTPGMIMSPEHYKAKFSLRV
ncbi:hypothetical protein HUJ04_003617 [Dendroctonus ponderosae]|nr:hypothetical protein HUJ04_003617 [Dendroctonus ponderosae]